MSNTPLVPCAQATRFSNSAASLSDLARGFCAEHAAVVQASNDVLNHVLAAGRFLIEAQGIVPKGQWAGWVSRSCEVSYRTARLYMQVTRAYEANGNGVASDLAGLSLRGLIRALASPRQANEVRRRHSRPVPAIPELSSLAWANASRAKRARFVFESGWRGFLEVMQPDWWPAIAEYLKAQLSKETAVTIDVDQNGNVLREDGSIPPFLDGIQGAARRKLTPSATG